MSAESFDLGLYTAAFNACEDAVIIQDSTRFLGCNQAALYLLKYDSEEALLSARPADFSPPKQPDGRSSCSAAEDAIARAVKQGAYRFDWVHRDRQGHDFNCAVSLVAFDWQGQRLIRATMRDVSRLAAERREAEVERACFNSLFDNTPVGIAMVDRSKAIIDVNPGFERLFQYSRDEVIHRNVVDCLMTKEMRATLSDELRYVAEQALHGAVGEVADTVRLRKDGSEAHVYMLVVPVMLEGETISACVIYGDRTAQWKAQEDLRQREEQMRTVLNNLPVVLYTMDTNGVFTMAEGKALEKLGLGKGEGIGRSIYDMYPDYKPLHDHFRAALKGETVTSKPVFGGVSFETRYFPLRDVDGEIKGVVGLARDVSDTQAVEKRLEYMALHDELTGLPNRTLLRRRIDSAIARAQETRMPFAMFFMDLDFFKTINDSLGHDAGDNVLKIVAGRFTSVLPQNATVARLGGDEFAVLIEDISSPHSVAVMAQKILEVLAATIPEKGVALNVSSSIGISLYPSDGADAGTLLRNADAAMYVAKETRNNYRFFAPEMNVSAMQTLLLRNSMGTGISRGEFVLYYQPLVDISTQAIKGFEALVRWNHPERGLIPPKEFIPLAEEMGLIIPLGEHILDIASKQAKAWMEQGHTDIQVAVNLSAKQFRNLHFVQRIGQISKKAGVSPDTLLLEVSASMLFPEPDITREVLSKFSGMRIAIEVDDFDIVYMSLDQLRGLNINYLKIDHSFIRNMPDDKVATDNTRKIIETGKELGLTVIAEGVETADQLAFLRKAECGEAQGFYFSKPVPVDEATAMLEAGKLSVGNN